LATALVMVLVSVTALAMVLAPASVSVWVRALVMGLMGNRTIRSRVRVPIRPLR
jgi:hypothetical protein